MTTDNRTNEPTDEQVEAAAKAMWDLRKREGEPEWGELEHGVKQEYRKDARAALAAADAHLPTVEMTCLEGSVSVMTPAERDAALAAIERVRALHREVGEQLDGAGVRYTVCEHCTQVNRYGQVRFPCPTRAALDGAPEPEPIEWVYRARNSILNSGAHVSEETARATLQLMIDNHVFEVEPEPVFIERRPRFSWLPVEGESDE